MLDAQQEKMLIDVYSAVFQLIEKVKRSHDYYVRKGYDSQSYEAVPLINELRSDLESLMNQFDNLLLLLDKENIDFIKSRGRMLDK